MKLKKLSLLFAVLAALCLGSLALVACDREPETPSGEKRLLSIVLEQKPTKLVYEIGESVDTSGMKVVAKFSDNTSADVTADCTTSLDGQKIKADTAS